MSLCLIVCLIYARAHCCMRSALALKFLQINNNILYLLAAQEQINFRLKFLCASHLKMKYFELPSCLRNWTHKNKIDWDAHQMSYISHWLLLVSVISASIQFRSDFVFRTFFLYTLYIAVVLCIVIGQLHADKCDYHAIYR